VSNLTRLFLILTLAVSIVTAYASASFADKKNNSNSSNSDDKDDKDKDKNNQNNQRRGRDKQKDDNNKSNAFQQLQSSQGNSNKQKDKDNDKQNNNSDKQGSSKNVQPLIIGNANYSFGKLENPVNDASDMAEALRGSGFEVILKTDADQAGMRDGIRSFGSALKASRWSNKSMTGTRCSITWRKRSALSVK